MPYKDIEKRKKMARDWAKKDRKENPERHKNAVLKWRKNHKDKYMAQKKKHYSKYRQRYLEKSKVLTQNKKRIILEHYGGTPPKCACCGESIYQFLTIEHIKGGGSKHRRELGAGNIYNFLIKNNFPKEYEILCYNCNCSKSYTKICPHKI